MKLEIHGKTYEIGARVDLSDADLHGADLSYADLSDADLHGANLRGADLSYASGYVDLGRDTRGYHFRAVAFPLGWQITAGCRNFTIDEALAHWRKAHNEDALARVAILKAYPLPGIGA